MQNTYDLNIGLISSNYKLILQETHRIQHMALSHGTWKQYDAISWY